MPLRVRSEVPSYPIRPTKLGKNPKRGLFIPQVGGGAPIGKVPVGLPTVDDRGKARAPFETDGSPLRNFFAGILYGLGVVIRSGR